MEIFGGFMVMASIFGFLLAVVWLILPFVVVAIKVKTDKSFLLLEDMNRRLTSLELRLTMDQRNTPGAEFHGSDRARLEEENPSG